MAEVVGEDERSHTEARGRQRGRGEGGDGGEVITEVIGDDEDRIAELLDPPRLRDQLVPAAGVGAVTPKRNGRTAMAHTTL